MTHCVTRGASALLASAILTAGTAASASAATWSHTDAAKDVQVSTDGGTTSTLDATNADTDVTRVAAANNARTVVVKVKTRAALPGKNFMIEVDIKTAAARYSASRVSMQGFTGNDLSKGSKSVSCSGLKFTIDRTTSVTQVTVPRSCLGNPGWVQVGAGIITMSSDSSGKMWADDGLRSGIGNTLALSPRIARG